MGRRGRLPRIELYIFMLVLRVLSQIHFLHNFFYPFFDHASACEVDLWDVSTVHFIQVKQILALFLDSFAILVTAF
jgi:hypothetical protein